MYLNQLEYFAATIEAGSFFAASKKVYVTAPAIERAVHLLESELKVELFEPAGRSYRPTQLGKKLYEPVIDAIACINRIYDIAHEHTLAELDDAEFDLVMASFPFRCGWLSPALFDQFKLDHPNIDLDILPSSNGACLEAMRSGMFDAAVVIGPIYEGDLRSRRLFSFPLKVAVSKSHNFASAAYGHLSLRTIAQYPIARPIDIGTCYKVIARAFDEAQVLPNFVDVRMGDEPEFLREGGIIFVADHASIKQIAPDTMVKDIAPRERIALPVCFVERPNETSVLSEHLAAYLATFGERMRKLQSKGLVIDPIE